MDLCTISQGLGIFVTGMSCRLPYMLSTKQLFCFDRREVLQNVLLSGDDLLSKIMFNRSEERSFPVTYTQGIQSADSIHAVNLLTSGLFTVNSM